MTAEFHKANRQRLYAEMKNGSAAVFFSGSAPRQSADAYYTFFTNRNFLYLTGIRGARVGRHKNRRQCAGIHLYPPAGSHERALDGPQTESR